MSNPDPADGPFRRVPKQARARERVARILRAARFELESRSVAEVTIEGIAKRAEVPVGSVYQYFDGKSALLVAVAASVMDEADAATAKQLVETYAMPWRDAVDTTIDTIFRYYRDRPHFGALLRTIRATGEFGYVSGDSNERMIELMSLHPAFARAGLDRDRTLLICRGVVTAVNAFQDEALALEDDAEFDAWMGEACRLVKAYFETYLGDVR